ncbi:GNAT family N-acyltransferase [Glaciimonas sp. CA11.2]|uniref:GNAT family N-acetyltransferase n=1 Tax=unclassified Glaciimonas TaxID=2644401 RepID=UPI002AB400CC|nr:MULTISPECIES: GNAT family N-acyltransferase [unclassified Glaciimonas]MDY7547929.1 GNAT family N-acyltransferase [Glaciimonas sp. CA11.2]MEB0010101.1 GNAT family N-acyltransferase [Glaciimonas sp. Cout2]MEB0081784.1 GNAT family N-acyltransferase [Glaciimonas sp. Gout2]MEB0165131.1 GNAT family N-acyltransferase [Glaciimonas sp. CA11.2]
MRLLTIPRDANPIFPKLTVSIATTQEEIREVQRLRYKVFVEAFSLSALVNVDGLDVDEFDAYCDHLIVRDNKTLRVVGTYRVMSPHASRRMGSYYSEKEFDLGRLDHLRNHLAEAGRACIHPDYRSGSVIMLLWAGLAAYMRRERCDYLMGCVSVSLADGGHNAVALYHSMTDENFSPPEYRVTPITPFSVYEREPGHVPIMPPLLKGYLRSGAWVCGEPAWDPDFHSADFFLLLPLARLDSRYARHYRKEMSPG